MRQVFSSPRLENVERVAQHLREHAIEVRITNGRSYKGSRRSDFSYREQDTSGAMPAVWVVKSDDQPRARELLREIGLLDSARSPTSYLPTSILQGNDAGGRADAARRRAFRVRAALFVGIALALGLSMFAWWKQAPVDAAARSASDSTSDSAPTIVPIEVRNAGRSVLAQRGAERTDITSTTQARTYVIPTPKALAATLVKAELAAHERVRRLCLEVDGRPPSAEQIEVLALPAHVALRPSSDCVQEQAANDALRIAVREYRTDGSGQGTVRIDIGDSKQDGSPRTERRALEVRRDDEHWRVLRVVQ
ncbi:MAG: hypothetical protein E6Q88_15155 [Lysobacteraceae bacterium]|nr:MAG: hypothetical protein E6Q88_15155 [Xanthomonadaceae bacterium]